jgi:di/tripeptidase
MEIDLRSVDPAALDVLDRRVQEAIERAATLESGRGNSGGRIAVSVERIGDRPPGRTHERSPIVQTALEVSSRLGIDASLTAASTDANAAMQLNIPAIAIGGGGRGMNTHSVDESFDTTGSVRGTERALLLVVALSRPQ